VVHVLRGQSDFFQPRKAGLAWADPVECLLDLHESRLEPQAEEFLEALRKPLPAFTVEELERDAFR
jgi:hypothetical protein